MVRVKLVCQLGIQKKYLNKKNKNAEPLLKMTHQRLNNKNGKDDNRNKCK